MRRGMIAVLGLAVLVALGLVLAPDRSKRDTSGSAALVRQGAPPVASQNTEPAATIPPVAEPVGEEAAGASSPAGQQVAAVDSRRSWQPDLAGTSAAEPEPAAEEPQPPDESAARLDLVRVSADGQLVVAGEAPAGAQVEVLLDGQAIGTAETDRDGSFAAFFELDPSDQPRRLSVRAADAAESASVIILPTGREEAAPLLVRAGPEEVEVLQPAPTPQEAELALDRITYRPGEDVAAAGRAGGTHVVRLYADGELVAELPVDEAGGWAATIPAPTARGASLLRFDEVSATGDVTARLEAPFDYREEGATQTLQKRPLTVERGNNLWRIAEAHYGDGLRYSIIFGANSALIRDPDLIYPGQVFAIPELVEAE